MKRLRIAATLGALAAALFAVPTSAVAAGSGPQPARPCQTEAGMASDSGPLTTITFVNDTAAPVRVYWLDWEGNRVLYVPSIPAGASEVQITFASHPWVVTDQAGTCLAVFMATGRASTAVVG